MFDVSKYRPMITWMVYAVSLILGVCVVLILGYLGWGAWIIGSLIWRIFFSDDPWGE